MKIITWIIAFLLLCAEPILAGPFPAEVKYLEFPSHMLDPETGYMTARIELTYVEEEDLVSLYYQSDCCKTAILLNKESREQLLKYLDKYREWNDKADELKTHEYGFKKFMGELDIGLYFKYTDGWHKAGPIIAYMHFITIHRGMHNLVIKPIKTRSKVNPYLVFRPSPLYFNYEDCGVLKQALQQDFILAQYKKALSERNNIADEFK